MESETPREPVPEETAEERRTGDQPGPRLRARPLVLVCDDEPDFLALVTEWLEGEGFRVARASTGGEAIQLALADPPDAILLDIYLPGADGFEVLRALRREPDTRQAVMIACTGIQRTPERPLLAAGFDAHFPKPVDFYSWAFRLPVSGPLLPGSRDSVSHPGICPHGA